MVSGLLLTLDTTGLLAGTFSDTIVLNAIGFNSSGFSGALAPIVLEVRGRVVQVSGVPSPATVLLILLVVPMMRFARRRIRD
jgi:hypothetical protein